MMSKKILIIIVSLFSSLIYNVQVIAWENETKKLFENDQYEKVINIAKEHKNDKSKKIGLMFLAFSHLQKYELQNTKSDKTLYKNYLEVLEDSVTVSHLDDLDYFIQQTDKPEVVKIAQKVLKGAFKNIKEVKHTPKLLSFIKSDDKKTRKIALKTVKRLFKNKRKYITKGGTLRDGGIEAMQDEKMIRALLDLAKDSSARDALIYMERPVLAYIADYEGKNIAKIKKKILKAIKKREKKYPDSSWYSATGKVRDTAVKFADM